MYPVRNRSRVPIPSNALPSTLYNFLFIQFPLLGFILGAEEVQFIGKWNQREETASFSSVGRAFPVQEASIVWRPIRQETGASAIQVAKRENLPADERAATSWDWVCGLVRKWHDRRISSTEPSTVSSVKSWAALFQRKWKPYQVEAKRSRGRRTEDRRSYPWWRSFIFNEF